MTLPDSQSTSTQTDDVKSQFGVRITSISVGTALVVWSLVDGPLIGGGLGFGWTQGGVLLAGLIVLSACLLPLKWNKTILVVFLFSGFAILVMELILRALFSARFYSPFQLDDHYLYKLIPGVV